MTVLWGGSKSLRLAINVRLLLFLAKPFLPLPDEYGR